MQSLSMQACAIMGPIRAPSRQAYPFLDLLQEAIDGEITFGKAKGSDVAFQKLLSTGTSA